MTATEFSIPDKKVSIHLKKKIKEEEIKFL